MADINGRYTICDRCGAKVFRRCTGEGEADGGYTRWNDFEPLPDGWDIVAIPHRKNEPCGNAHNGYLQVCPNCHERWNTLINEDFLSGTPYYQKIEPTIYAATDAGQ